MTQILAALTPEYVLVVADSRLTFVSGPNKGEIKDDDTCKLVSLCGVWGIAYTGFSDLQGVPTHEWIAVRLFTQEGAKRWTRWAPGCIVAILITALPLLAHHGSVGYDTRNPVTLTGTIRNIEWMNPHSFIYLDVTRDNGIVETWALEGTPPNALERQTGWTKGTFKPGTRITVIGFLPSETFPNGSGTFHSLDEALAYSPRAVDYLKTRHALQTGDIRLPTGEVRRFGMGPAFNAQR